jgi:hypothetical protein
MGPAHCRHRGHEGCSFADDADGSGARLSQAQAAQSWRREAPAAQSWAVREPFEPLSDAGLTGAGAGIMVYTLNVSDWVRSLHDIYIYGQYY